MDYKPTFHPKKKIEKPFYIPSGCIYRVFIYDEAFCNKFKEWHPNCTMVCPCVKEHEDHISPALKEYAKLYRGVKY